MRYLIDEEPFEGYSKFENPIELLDKLIEEEIDTNLEIIRGDERTYGNSNRLVMSRDALYENDLDFLVADLFEDDDTEFAKEAETSKGISCVTPGNPYILHCFRRSRRN